MSSSVLSCWSSELCGSCREQQEWLTAYHDIPSHSLTACWSQSSPLTANWPNGATDCSLLSKQSSTDVSLGAHVDSSTLEWGTGCL